MESKKLEEVEILDGNGQRAIVRPKDMVEFLYIDPAKCAGNNNLKLCAELLREGGNDLPFHVNLLERMQRNILRESCIILSIEQPEDGCAKINAITPTGKFVSHPAACFRAKTKR